MSRLLILILLFFTLFCDLASEKEGRALIDSLLTELDDIEKDTNAVNLFTELSVNYYIMDTDSGLMYAKKALQLAKEIDWKRGIAKARNSLATNYWAKNKLPEAMENYIQMLDIFEQMNYKPGIAVGLSNLAMIYSDMEQYDKALVYYQKAVKMEKELNNQSSLARNYGNLGIVHQRIGNNDSALYYHFKSLEIHKKLDTKMPISINYLNIGSIYIEDTVYAKAYDYNIQAFDLAKELENKRVMALSLANIGNVYLLVYYNFPKIETAYDFAFSSRERNLEKAIEYLERSKDLLLDINDKKNLKEITNFLMDAYLVKHDFDKASQYREAFETLRDSLMTEKAHARIAQLDASRELELKDKQLKIKELQIQSKNVQITIIIIALVLLAIISIIFLRMNNQKRKINDKLVEQSRIISEQNATKDKFFSIIAHDLRNPVSTISQSIDVLHDEFDNLDKQELKEYIADLRKSSQNLYALVEDLLTWSRSQRGIIHANKETYQAKDIVERAISQIEAQAAKKDIQILNKVPESKKVHIDAALTITILRNILSNSIKFSEFNSSVEVSLGKCENGKDSFKIKDHGIGMDQQTIDSLFKIDNAHSGIGTAGEKGTGLGLIVCKEFADKQDGSIEVESKAGKGSTFTFVFPAENR